MNYNKDSESLGNIKKAFDREASGHVRYMILTDSAEANGNHDLARLYRQLADEEYAHAKNWYGEMNGDVDEDAALRESAAYEENEYKFVYPQLASSAELEGYEALADKFNANAKAEYGHSDLIKGYISDMEDKKRYKKNEDVVWRCCVCGYTHTGVNPPEQCPLCGHNKTAYCCS